MITKRVVVATPHTRYDLLEHALRLQGLEVLRLRGPTDLDLNRLTAFGPRYVFFPHWSWRIPAAVYEGFECVVFHMADLPFGRGGSPLQNQVVRGIEETKLTALRCVAELDSGPIYQKRPLSLLGSAEEVYLRAAETMLSMILDMIHHQPAPVPQTGDVVMFRRRSAEDGDLRAAATLRAVHDIIRMLDADGYPPAFLDVGPLHLEFTRASRRYDHVAADVKIFLNGDRKE